MVWKLFFWSSLRKSYSICLENSDLAKLWPFKTKIWPFFGKNWLFWPLIPYNPTKRFIRDEKKTVTTRHSMIGSPERVKIQRSSIPKIRKIHSCVWKLYVKNSQNKQFLQKNWQIFVLNGQSFAKSEFSRHIEYDLLKEDHKNNLHTKN